MAKLLEMINCLYLQKARSMISLPAASPWHKLARLEKNQKDGKLSLNGYLASFCIGAIGR